MSPIEPIADETAVRLICQVTNDELTMFYLPSINSVAKNLLVDSGNLLTRD